MANNKRQLSSIKNRDWSSKTQKENAKYVKSKLEMLGYKVPAYMKKGQISTQQLEFYTNRIMSRLEKIVETERRSKLSYAEKRRENNAPIEKRLKEYKKLRDSVIKSANTMGGKEGEVYRGLAIDGKNYGFDALSSTAKGHRRPSLTTVKDLKNFLTKDLISHGKLTQKKMLNFLDSEIKQMKEESTFELFKKQAIDSFSDAFQSQVIESVNKHLEIKFEGIDEDKQQSIKDRAETFINDMSKYYPLALKFASQEILELYDERYKYWLDIGKTPEDATILALNDVRDYLSTWSINDLKEV